MESIYFQIKTENSFPVNAFPGVIQTFIEDCYSSLNFPKEYLSTAILYALSVAIGNTYNIEVKKGWTEPPIVFCVIVGPKGANKTHPVKQALKPIFRRDKELYSFASLSAFVTTVCVFLDNIQ